MNDLYYLRDFTEKFGFGEIDPIERLLLSCQLTKFLTKDPRDSVEILFCLNANGHDKWACYKEYVEANDKMLQSAHGFLFDNVINQARENARALYTVRMPLDRLNLDGRSSLTNIAFKTYAIAASMHPSKEDDVNWFDIPIYYWSSGYSSHKKRRIVGINEWLTENKIYAELIHAGNAVHIFNKKKQKEMTEAHKTVYLEGFEG
jgi:hypothetical protein